MLFLLEQEEESCHQVLDSDHCFNDIDPVEFFEHVKDSGEDAQVSEQEEVEAKFLRDDKQEPKYFHGKINVSPEFLQNQNFQESQLKLTVDPIRLS